MNLRTPRNPGPPHVLVVEDDENDVFFLRRALQGVGVEIDLHVASDGREAMDYLLGREGFNDRTKHPLPNVVLLDLKVPYLSGLDVLRQIRATPELRRLVVVILTSSALESDVSQAYEIGANSFLVKPSRLEEQRELAHRIVGYWLQSNLPSRLVGGHDGAWA